MARPKLRTKPIAPTQDQLLALWNKAQALCVKMKQCPGEAFMEEMQDIIIEAIPVYENQCPECGTPMSYYMFDIDGTNLEELLVCQECGHNKPNQ